MHAHGAEPHCNLCRIGGSIEVQLASQVAPPTGVRTSEKAGKLSELCLPPVEIDMDGHVAKRVGTSYACLHAHHACVFQIQAHVCPGRLAAQANAPLAG